MHFLGCGKTYLFRNQIELGYKILDSDSSKFEKGEGWEKEYVNHIQSNADKYDFIFVSQHEEVLKELSKRKIPFLVSAPLNDNSISEKERLLIKQQWFGRFLLRDNSHIKDLTSWLNSLNEHYDEWTSYKHLTQFKPEKLILLKENEYLSDKIDEIYKQR